MNTYSNALPVPQLLMLDDQPYLAITFRRRTVRPGTSFAIEASSDLAKWSEFPNIVLVRRTDHGDGTYTETWRACAPAGIMSRMFLRVREGLVAEAA